MQKCPLFSGTQFTWHLSDQQQSKPSFLHHPIFYLFAQCYKLFLSILWQQVLNQQNSYLSGQERDCSFTDLLIAVQNL